MKRSKYNSIHIPKILTSSVDANWLNAATSAITGVETGVGISATRSREDVGGLRGIVHDIKGTKEKDISLGVGKVKFSSLDNFAKTYFDIDTPKDLGNDNKAVDAVSYNLVKHYELFKDYANQYPELGLEEEDIRNMSILAHNQGTRRLLKTGRNQKNKLSSKEEVAALRDLYEGTMTDITSTNYKNVPVIGKLAYKTALAIGQEKPEERYISKVNRYIDEVYNIPSLRETIGEKTAYNPSDQDKGWLDKY